MAQVRGHVGQYYLYWAAGGIIALVIRHIGRCVIPKVNVVNGAAAGVCVPLVIAV